VVTSYKWRKNLRFAGWSGCLASAKDPEGWGATGQGSRVVLETAGLGRD